MNLIKRYPLASFVTIALAISWIIWIPLIVLGQDLLSGITGFMIIVPAILQIAAFIWYNRTK